MTKGFGKKIVVVFMGNIICNEQADEQHEFVCRSNFRVLDKSLFALTKYITKIEVYGNGYLVHLINGTKKSFCIK